MTEPGNTAEPRRTLADFLDIPGVYPAGRLDYDSEGLIVLTSDGALQHRISNPAYAHPRTYWVQVEGEITSQALALMQVGICIRDYRTKPCAAMLIPKPDLPARNPPVRSRKSIPTAWIQLILKEGRNRQVRRMTAAVGFPTLRLARVAIGELGIGSLEPGRWRDLRSQEIKRLLSGNS